MKKLILGSLLTILTLSNANALNIKEKKTLKDWNKRMEKELVQFEKACKYKPEVVINEDMVNFIPANKSGDGYCDGVLGGIEMVCGIDEDTRKYVQEKIKKVVCRFNKEETSEVKLAVKDGTLDSQLSLKSNNIYQRVDKWLQTNL